MGKPYVRREAQLKAEVLQIVERSPLPVRQRGIFNRCVNSQAVYPLSEQHGLEAQERR